MLRVGGGCHARAETGGQIGHQWEGTVMRTSYTLRCGSRRGYAVLGTPLNPSRTLPQLRKLQVPTHITAHVLLSKLLHRQVAPCDRPANLTPVANMNCRVGTREPPHPGVLLLSDHHALQVRNDKLHGLPGRLYIREVRKCGSQVAAHLLDVGLLI